MAHCSVGSAPKLGWSLVDIEHIPPCLAIWLLRKQRLDPRSKAAYLPGAAEFAAPQGAPIRKRLPRQSGSPRAKKNPATPARTVSESVKKKSGGENGRIDAVAGPKKYFPPYVVLNLAKAGMTELGCASDLLVMSYSCPGMPTLA